MPRLTFSREEYMQRLNKVCEAALGKGIDYLIVHRPEYLCWISGFNPTALMYQSQLHIDVQTRDAVILTHRGEEALARETSTLDEVVVWRHGQDPNTLGIELARSHLRQGKTSTIGMTLDAYFLKVTDYLAFKHGMEPANIVDVTALIEELRLSKSQAEVEVLRQCASLADEGYNAAIRVIRPGVTEREVNAAIQERLYSLGCEYPSFPTLVSAGSNTGMFHALPSDYVIEEGDPVNMEINGVLHRYHTNLVRTVWVGQAPERAREVYSIVSNAYQAGLDLCTAGTPVREIDLATRAVRSDAGFGEYIPARSGFGVDLAYPPFWGTISLLHSDPHVLQVGYAISLEPSISGYNGWTVCLGNNILITEAGPEVLFSSPEELVEIG